MMDDPYLLCLDLNGRCSCLNEQRSPCDAIQQLCDEGETAEAEIARIEQERQDAAFEGGPE